ncbi:MAG: hypothetical protein AB7Q27_26050 [Acidimicrobiia bacterium]
MTSLTRRLLPVVLVAAAVLIPADTAAAHGGTDVTSNYRTRIVDAPTSAGLSIAIVDIDGTVEVTWNGTGVVQIAGYENEPYLRIDSSGVYENRRSPATYLNRDRYANVETPKNVDPAASPDWQLATRATTVRWHDHRTHWMSARPPLAVQQDPGRRHVIIEQWEIPVTVAGETGVVTGDLIWSPPPPLLLWVAMAIGIGMLSCWLLWSRWQRPVAATLGIIAAVALTVDTAGYVAVSTDTLANRIWAFIYAALATWAAGRLIVHALRRTPHPTLAMSAAVLIAALMGGVDRFDVLTNSEIYTALPPSASRAATTLCLGIGVALVVRFLVYLLALSTGQAEPAGTNPVLEAA